MCSIITLFGFGIELYSLWCSIPAFILAIKSMRTREVKQAVISIVLSFIVIVPNLLLAANLGIVFGCCH